MENKRIGAFCFIKSNWTVSHSRGRKKQCTSVSLCDHWMLTPGVPVSRSSSSWEVPCAGGTSGRAGLHTAVALDDSVHHCDSSSPEAEPGMQD